MIYLHPRSLLHISCNVSSHVDKYVSSRRDGLLNYWLRPKERAHGQI
jgi:hypothetical protein